MKRVSREWGDETEQSRTASDDRRVSQLATTTGIPLIKVQLYFLSGTHHNAKCTAGPRLSRGGASFDISKARGFRSAQGRVNARSPAPAVFDKFAFIEEECKRTSAFRNWVCQLLSKLHFIRVGGALSGRESILFSGTGKSANKVCTLDNPRAWAQFPLGFFFFFFFSSSIRPTLGITGKSQLEEFAQKKRRITLREQEERNKHNEERGRKLGLSMRLRKMIFHVVESSIVAAFLPPERDVRLHCADLALCLSR